MSIFVHDGQAFVKCGGNTMLCIGSAEEVDKADPVMLGKLILTAIATGDYNRIKSGIGRTRH